MHLAELKKKSVQELSDTAEHLGIEGAATLRRQELVFAILKAQGSKGEISADGVIEVLPDGFGFLRAPDCNYLPGADDIYVSPSQIRRFNLRTGDTIAGWIRPPKEAERYFALLRVESVNGDAPEGRRTKTLFDNLTPVYPTRRFHLEHDRGNLATRVLDLLIPLGFGQRCLMMAPPRAGKTVLLRDLARAIERNHPDVLVIVLLIDERPEEVTEMRRAVAGEVVSSTFDEPPARHVQVAEIVLEKAKRLAESKRDVVVLLDSLTRLTRAYNTVVAPSGKTLAGGLDANALSKPKRFFGAARSLEEGGSLTIIATAMTDTGARADEVILEELQGTGNCEIVLDHRLVERRVFPAIDVKASVTLRDELLIAPDDQAAVAALRTQLQPLDAIDAMELLRTKLGATATNADLLTSR